MASESVEPANDVVEGEHIVQPENVVVEPRRTVAIKRLIVWLLFGAVFGLMPLFAVSLKEVFSSGGFHINNVLKNGDLFIVSAVLAAGAIGELLAATTRGLSSFVAVIAGFFCLATFAGDTIAYVVVGSASASEIATASYWFFPITLVASGVCVGTAAYG